MKKQNKMKVGIIGLGMVGTPIRKYLETKRNYRRKVNLFLFDTDQSKKCNDDINLADVIFVCVPTPSNKTGIFDLTILRKAISTIGPNKIVVVKSTINPGTIALLQKDYPDILFMFNPEFLTEANAWDDFLHPDRQLVGGTEASWDYSSKVLRLLPKAPISIPSKEKRMTTTEAELVKISANVFGSMKVAYANIINDMVLGLNKYLKNKGVSGIEGVAEYDTVKKMIGADSRIGEYWLEVNHSHYRGFGGYCFPKDLRSFIHSFDSIINNLKWSKEDKGLVNCLKSGQNVLKSIWKYNEELLKMQDLTIDDVSHHDKDINIKN